MIPSAIMATNLYILSATVLYILKNVISTEYTQKEDVLKNYSEIEISRIGLIIFLLCRHYNFYNHD